MKRIEEIQGLTGLSYKIFTEINKEYFVSIDGFKKEHNNFVYLLLINCNGGIIEDSYKYLNGIENNKCIGEADYKKREMAFIALKLLYSYMALFYITDLKDIDSKEIKRLEAFLKGGEKIGHSVTFKSKTTRTESTINKYYSVYRNYFRFLNITPNIFAETIKIRKTKGLGDGFLAHGKITTEEKYLVSYKELNKKETPKYISYKEYLKLKMVIEEEYTDREEIIIDIMYKYGLRIGEVLGLTIEDVDITKNTLFIRNRLSDKSYQKAKGCSPVFTKSDYNSKSYRTKNAGYQEVEVDEEDIEKIHEYIINSRSPLNYRRRDRKKSIIIHNLETKNIADKVTDREDVLQNSYIFISKNGTPISNTGWNNIIKKLYISIGLTIDINKREDNLNHRLRHGFAMYKVLVENYDQLKLKNALRHEDINSCKVYFKIDEKERARLAKETQELIKKGGLNI